MDTIAEELMIDEYYPEAVWSPNGSLTQETMSL